MRILLFLQLLCTGVFAQGGFIFVSGRIIDKNVGSPLMDTYIGMPGSGYASSSNPDGQYLLRFPQLSKDSTLLISKLGYKPLYLHYTDLKPTVFLEPEVELKSMYEIKDPRFFFKNVVDSIPSNYASTPYFQQGFYSEKVSTPSMGCLRLTEAELRIERDPKKKQQRVKQLLGRNIESKNTRSSAQKWGFSNGTELLCRSLEIELPDFLEAKNRNKYEFSLDRKISNYDGTLVIIFNFKPINKDLKGGKIGKIYIEPESLAIVRIEYEISKESLQNLIDLEKNNETTRGKSAFVEFQYRKFQDKWRLEYSKASILVNFANQGNYDLSSLLELKYCTFENQNLAKLSIPTGEVLKTKKEFKGKNPNANYWSPYIYLLPDKESQKLLK